MIPSKNVRNPWHIYVTGEGERLLSWHFILSYLISPVSSYLWSDLIRSYLISSPSPFPSHLSNFISALISSHLYHLYNLISPYHPLMSPHLISTFLISSFFFISGLQRERVRPHRQVWLGRLLERLWWLHLFTEDPTGNCRPFGHQ